jgi:hypothetical protein
MKYLYVVGEIISSSVSRLRWLPTLILLVTTSAFAQSTTENVNSIAENVKYLVSDGKVYITYDLPGSTNQLYDVSLILKRAGKVEAGYEPITVSGNIGESQRGGKNKQIIWDLKKDFPEGLAGEDFYFIVRAEKIDEGSDFLIWVAGIGLAAVAAVVTYTVVSDESESSSSQSPVGSFPPPPGRP